MDNAFIKTNRPVITYTIEITEDEGSSNNGFSGWLIWAILMLGILFLTIFVFISIIPLGIIILVDFIIGLWLMLVIPLQLKKKMQNFYQLVESTGNDIASLNNIIDINKDNLILWNDGTVGYMLVCKPNFYNSYKSYSEDFKQFLEIFSDFNIMIDGLKNTRPIPYVKTDELGIYNDKEVILDRLSLSSFTTEKYSKVSNAYAIVIVVSTIQENLRKLNSQMEEMKYSESKKVFRNITIADADMVFGVISRDLGIRLTRNYLLMNKDSKDIDITKQDNILIER